MFLGLCVLADPWSRSRLFDPKPVEFELFRSWNAQKTWFWVSVCSQALESAVGSPTPKQSFSSFSQAGMLKKHVFRVVCAVRPLGQH
jgi:hypothetical protein